MKGCPLKHLLDLNDSGTWGEDPTGSHDVVVLRSTDIGLDGSWRIHDPALRHVTGVDSLKKRLAQGDIVVVKSSGSPEHLGKSAIVTEAVAKMKPCFANFVQRLRPSSSTDSRYIWYVLNSTSATDAMASLGNTTTGLRNLNGEIIGSVVIPVTELSKQQAIADYLDIGTSRIDALVTKKRRMIELLHHRLTSLSTQLVSGVHGEQESGIPSIPFIPRQWKVLRNKTFMHEVTDRSPTGEEELLSVSHLTGVTPRSQKTVYMFEAESTVGYKLVRPGDLAVNTMWAWMGAAGVSKYYGIVSPSYGVYRIDQSIVLPEYLDLLVRTPAYVCEMTRYSRGVTSSRLRLYSEELLGLRTPVPPKSEQQAIVRHFEAATMSSRSAIDALDRQVELLAERRQSLITAGVTGELAIPGVAA